MAPHEHKFLGEWPRTLTTWSKDDTRLLLVKPERRDNELLSGFSGQDEILRAEVVAQEVEASLDPADKGLVRDGVTSGLGQSQMKVGRWCHVGCWG
jgi:hypothetical protein